MTNHYKTLGLGTNATTQEIKSAYYSLSKRHHPDMEGGDQKTFQAVSAAYEILSDPEKRRAYDNNQRNKAVQNLPESVRRVVGEYFEQC